MTTKKAWWKRINWHVLQVGIGGLFVAGSPLAAVMTAFGIPDEFTSDVFRKAGAVVLLAGAMYVVVKASMYVTDKGKAKMLSSLDKEAKENVVNNMPVYQVQELATAINGKVNHGEETKK